MAWLDWLPWMANKQQPYFKLKSKLESYTSVPVVPTPHEKKIIENIRTDTEYLNRNNVSRTMAYYDYFERNQEIEWSLLAHMVSRNGGWSMTDLQGEWCSRILTWQEKRDFFLFLERANWLIFQDAYPQLRLYEESKKLNQRLFHLLPLFHVSVFMSVMWNDFWETRERERLTLSLIINEQQYIEQRVIDQQHYAAPVIHELKFSVQDWLDLNMILFPAYTVSGEVKLHGRQVDSFPDLSKRIALGKELYSLLFSPKVFQGVLSWCRDTPHTGSREDYWPAFFGSKSKQNLDKPLELRLEKSRKKEGISLAYSPKLEQVWPDQVHQPAMIKDWFHDSDIVELLQTKEIVVKDVEGDYDQMLGKLEQMVYAKEKLKKVVPVGET